MVIIPPVAVLTVAGFPAPKSTTSFATVVEKPVPWMTTLFPPAGRPEAGTMLVRVGVAAPAVPTLTNVNTAPIVPRQRASATRPFTNLRNSETQTETTE